MKSKILFLARYSLFWLILFNSSRLVFVAYYFQKMKEISWPLIFAMPYHALALDLSMISYISALPLIFLCIQDLTEKNWASKSTKIYSFIITLVYLLIVAAELNLYAEWQTKIDYRAVVYLAQPSEVFQTATYAQTVIFFTYTLILFIGAYKLYHFLVPSYASSITSLKTSKKTGLVVLHFLAGAVLIALGLRGGWQQIPINQSWSYYTNNNTVNLASVNSLWNLLGSLYQNNRSMDKNPYITMPVAEAQKEVKRLHEVAIDSTVYFLNNKRPNIVMLILESFSSDLIQSCGGDTGITPQIEKLIAQGYLFDNIYATGTLSHQGIASLFSGFPSEPEVSIIKEHAKFSKLPSLNKRLLKLGYNTSFYFGGQLTYANIKSYLYFNQFHKLKDIYDYDSSIPSGKLGIHDQYTLADHLQELQTKPQPFFSALFTVSTHSPYDIPAKWKIEKGGSERDYLNGANYSDSCIGAYIDACKKQDWYKNTLFILVADHSKHTHYDRNYFEPLNRKIPLIFYGDVLKDEYRGKKNHFLGSQNDFVSTLLKQMKQSSKEFEWSRNMMNPYTKEFAYYALTTGFGWLAPGNNWLTYNYQSKSNDFNKCSSPALADSLNKSGKAYLQVLFQEYLDY